MYGPVSKWGVPGRERTLAVSPFGYAEGRRLVAAPSLARHCFLCGGHRWVAPAQSWVVGEGVLERASPATGISLRKAGLSGCTLHPEASAWWALPSQTTGNTAYGTPRVPNLLH